MIRADVLVNNKAWKEYISEPNDYLENKLRKARKTISVFKTKKLNFTLLLSGSNEITKLNKKFRKKNKSTDILSFPFHENSFLNKLMKKVDNDIYLGDIIINLDKINKGRNKQKFLIAFDKIWIHGLTHLLGYRHKSNRDFSKMSKVENKIFKSIK